MATIQKAGTELHIQTDAYSCTIALEGYVSGVKGGTFVDRATGAADLGHGLDIADFLLEPTAERSDDPWVPYHHGDLYHGNIPKRYVELPQICTQAETLEPHIVEGEDFVAVRFQYQWTDTRGDLPGSMWEQTLVFVDGLRYFFSADKITSARDYDALIFRLDLPGHLKHKQGNNFSRVYLSYHGEIPSDAFFKDFAPDEQFLYTRDDSNIPECLIRGYQTLLDGTPGPWLAGITLNPSDVYQAWCHQRGYICFIEEIGGKPITRGQSFGAAYAIGFFDDIAEMHTVAEKLHGMRGIEFGRTGTSPAQWHWQKTI